MGNLLTLLLSNQPAYTHFSLRSIILSKIVLFSYDFGKTKEICVNEIKITQTYPTRHPELVSVVRLELTRNEILQDIVIDKTTSIGALG